MTVLFLPKTNEIETTAAEGDMIESVEFIRFKGIGFQEIKLEPLTVILGANATGKSSVLQGIYIAIEHASDRDLDDDERRWIASRIASRHHHEATSVRCKVPGGDFGFKTTYGPLTTNGVKRDHERQSLWNLESLPNNPDERRDLAFNSSPAFIVRFNVQQLASNSYLDTAKPRLGTDGFGLPSVLAALKLGDESKFKLVEAQLRSFVPGIRSIRIAKAEVKRKETDYQTIEGKEYSREVERSYSGESLLFDFDHATGVPAGSVSDGTLFLLGLLTVMHGNGNVRTILVDDLGDGLHPTAQRELIRLLKAFVETSGVQVIATSHSPFVLDDLTGDQVVLASLDKNGESVFGKMNSHPDFDRWKNEMTPGEYWTMIGENWVTQGSGENSDAADIGVELER